MEIADLLHPDAVLANLKGTSKKQVLQELAARAAALTGQDEQAIFATLIEREKLGTTGVGNGVAIPHGRLPGIEAPWALFARLEKGIDFDAVDGQKVDLIFLLLAPEAAGADHLKALSRISRCLRNGELCTKLRGADDPEALYALLTENAVNRAA